jgi:DNA-binding response OmpR family regulator
MPGIEDGRWNWWDGLVAELERAFPSDVLDVRPVDDRAVQLTVARRSEGAGVSDVDPAGCRPRALDTVSVRHRLAYDSRSGTFYLRGEPLELPLQRYRLLRFFADHPNQRGAWGEGWEDNVEVLRVCVNRLRDALPGVGGQLIQNRRGRGYCFVPEATAPRRGR